MAGDQELLRSSRNPRHEGALRRSPTLSALCRPCITDLLVLACPFGCAGMEHGAVLGIIIQSAHALDCIAQFAGLRLHLVHGMSTAAMGSAPLPLLEAAARWLGGQEMGPGLRHGRHGCQGAATTPRRRPPPAASDDEGAPRARSIFDAIGCPVAGQNAGCMMVWTEGHATWRALELWRELWRP